MSKEVTNKELLQAITANAGAIKTVAEQVASNSEKLTELQNDIAHLPEQLGVRNSETFKDHEERITTLEVETGLAESVA